MRSLMIIVALLFGTQVARAEDASTAESVKQKIRTMRAYTLTDALALDEITASKLFPALAKWDDAVDKVVTARVENTRKLRKATNDAELDRLIDAQIANQRALWDIEEKRVADVRKILTPAQTAKLLVVLPQFERKLQNQLRKAMRGMPRADRPAVRKKGQRGKLKNPFGDDTNVEAFDEDDPDLAPPTPTPRTPGAKCDPFGSLHGCK